MTASTSGGSSLVWRGAAPIRTGCVLSLNEAQLEALLGELRSKLERIEERLKPTPTCLTYPKAAERIGIGLTKLKSMVRDGTIRPSTVGGMKMISIAECDRVCVPDQEKPALERKQREERWVPIEKKRR